MAALKEVVVPDIGDFDDVPITEILVGVGDTIAPEDPLVVLESDKATMEVPAPFGGVVKELKVKVEDKVRQGVPLLVLEVADAAAAEAAPTNGAPSAEAAAPGAIASAVTAEAQAQSAPEQAESAPEQAESAPEPAEPTPAKAGPAPAQAEPAAQAEPVHGTETDGPVHASPAVRRLARERGIDLHGVTGSGRKGRITKDDLDGSQAATREPAAAPSAAPAAAGDERVPLTRIQAISARKLAEAWQTIPHVTQHEDADITELEAFRKGLNAEQSDVKVTMVALLLKATAASLRAFPRFASQLDGDELVIKHDLHLGFAADTPNGLVVPVVRDVDRKGIFELAADLTDLSGKARAAKLSPKEMSGAVFTISSLGGIGGTGFTPIVNPPQVAILGVVRSRMQPVWDGGEFVPRLILPLSLSYDHRVIDGAAAARFCVHLAGVLADLRRVLL